MKLINLKKNNQKKKKKLEEQIKKEEEAMEDFKNKSEELIQKKIDEF